MLKCVCTSGTREPADKKPERGEGSALHGGDRSVLQRQLHAHSSSLSLCLRCRQGLWLAAERSEHAFLPRHPMDPMHPPSLQLLSKACVSPWEGWDAFCPSPPSQETKPSPALSHRYGSHSCAGRHRHWTSMSGREAHQQRATSSGSHLMGEEREGPFFQPSPASLGVGWSKNCAYLGS